MTFRLGARSLALATLLTSAVFTFSPAGATTKPHVVVTPVGGLTNGAKVRVTGTGFVPKDSLYIVECLVTAKSQTGCSINGLVPVVANAKGSFATTTFIVSTGKIGNGTCGTTKANLKACAISVGNANGTDSAVAPITFVLKSAQG